MMKSSRWFLSGKYREALIIGFLFVLAVTFGWFYLHLPGIKVFADTDDKGAALGPALLWAMGYGMSRTLFTSQSPETEAFVNQERDSLSPSEFSPPLLTFPAAGKFFYDRQYTQYTVGVLWRIFGVSWDVLKGLLAVMFATMAILTYGIFRLGINRGLSLLGTLLTMFSPLMLSQLPWLRSLGKAPFILGAALAAGYMLSRPMRRGSYLALSAFLGLAMGYGLGFRQDVSICLPALVAVMLFGVHGERPITWPWRLVGVALLCGICFAVLELPRRDWTQRSVGNNSFYLTQGFASSSRDIVELDLSGIHPVYSNSDLAVQGQVEHYATVQPDRMDRKSILQLSRNYACFTAVSDLISLAPLSAISNLLMYDWSAFWRTEDTSVRMWTDEAERVTRGMVRYLYLTFPADAITRCYGSALHIVRNLDHKLPGAPEPPPWLSYTAPFVQMIAAHLHEFGFLYTAATLIILAGIRLRLGFGALFLLFYFCGYTGIQFQTRHAFHLNLFSFWGPLFLLGVAGHLASGVFRNVRTQSFKQLLAPTSWRAPLQRVLIFGAVVAVLFAAPLYVARAWQYFTAGRVLAHYQSANLEPLPFHVSDSDAGPLYCPDRLPSHETPFDPLSDFALAQVDKREFTPEYLAADVTTNAPISPLSFQYVNPALEMDGFTCFATGAPSAGPRTFRFFFPVYHPSQRVVGTARENQSRDFKGVTLGPGMALKALYRVRNINDFPVLMCLWLPLDGQPVWCYDRLPAVVGS